MSSKYKELNQKLADIIIMIMFSSFIIFLFIVLVIVLFFVWIAPFLGIAGFLTSLCLVANFLLVFMLLAGFIESLKCRNGLLALICLGLGIYSSFIIWFINSHIT